MTNYCYNNDCYRTQFRVQCCLNFPQETTLKRKKNTIFARRRADGKWCVWRNIMQIYQKVTAFLVIFYQFRKKKLCFWRLVACLPIHTHFKENNCNWGFIWVIFEYTRLFQDNFSIYSGDTFWREATTDGFVYLQDAENWGSKWDWIKPSSFCLSIQNP